MNEYLEERYIDRIRRLNMRLMELHSQLRESRKRECRCGQHSANGSANVDLLEEYDAEPT